MVIIRQKYVVKLLSKSSNFVKTISSMEINKPINRRKALKVLGLGMLATCAPSLPASATGISKDEKKTKRLIFYFSATGNSLYVAREIAGDEGKLLSISQEIHNEQPEYEAEEIGFVCPIYCFLPPAIVQDFIARSTFKADYFFTVGTFGAHSTIFPEFFDNMAKERGIHMNYISALQMVDTYLPYFDIEKELANPKIDAIPERLAAIVASINNRENYILPVTQHDRMICEGYYRSSGRDRKRPTVTRSEKIVFSTEACVGCGICTGVCPHGSWKLVNGRSVAEGDCENCLACVHNCPMKAISIIPTPPEPEEANRNARFRNPNVSVADLIKSNSQI